MRLSILTTFGALAATVQAGCPYMKRDDTPAAAPASERSIYNSGKAEGKLGVMFMNRIAPSVSTLYIANADGTNERALFGDNSTTFDYHPSFSPDGTWVTFTSERVGDGQSDVYRVRTNGTGLETLVSTPAFEDAGALSPDNTKLVYVSTEGNHTANIWIKDLETGVAFNLTNTATTKGDNAKPDGHYRPSWSPDGEWILFSSDRNTNWTGHNNGTGWEHTNTLSIYRIRPNGSDFELIVAPEEGYSYGSPRWSPDGTRVIAYFMDRDSTYNAHLPYAAGCSSSIISVDVATGTDIVFHTTDDVCKISPQFVTSDVIGYIAKAGDYAGINYNANGTNTTTVDGTTYTTILGSMRNPSWSTDGKLVIYEKPLTDPVRPIGKPLYSWDGDFEYRHMDVFPMLSKQGVTAYSQKQTGSANLSIVTQNPDGSDLKLVFDPLSTDVIDPILNVEGLAGAFQPTWSSDGQWIAFSLGNWFTERSTLGGWLYRATANGSYSEQLTFGISGEVNSGFPSYSPDGTLLVYRDFGSEWGLGLRLLNLTDMTVTNLTNTWDNTPGWSPDGERIVFTRRNQLDLADLTATDSFDVYTIHPNGTGLTQLTFSGANDAHAIWTPDGRIQYSTGMWGFREESANYDTAFQPYGQIMVMNADGSNKTLLTDTMWEDSMPLYVLNADL